MDFRTRLEQGKNRKRSGSEYEPGGKEDNAFFGIEYERTVPTCLDLRLQQGTRIALPYSFFTSLSHDSENGIEIFTNNKRITITGRNLTKLYDQLIRYRVRYIQASIGNDESEEGLFVKGIKVGEVGL
jgi:hypothetical protein